MDGRKKDFSCHKKRAKYLNFSRVLVSRYIGLLNKRIKIITAFFTFNSINWCNISWLWHFFHDTSFFLRKSFSTRRKSFLYNTQKWDSKKHVNFSTWKTFLLTRRYQSFQFLNEVNVFKKRYVKRRGPLYCLLNLSCLRFAISEKGEQRNTTDLFLKNRIPLWQ